MTFVLIPPPIRSTTDRIKWSWWQIRSAAFLRVVLNVRRTGRLTRPMRFANLVRPGSKKARRRQGNLALRLNCLLPQIGLASA